jgi:hypothetical protein
VVVTDDGNQVRDPDAEHPLLPHRWASDHELEHLR